MSEGQLVVQTPTLLSSFQAVIFDLDGVIVDSEPLHERAYREIFAELGYGDSHDIDFTRYYGKSDEALWLDFIDKHRPRQSLEELWALKQERFLELVGKDKPIFDQFEKTLLFECPE